MLGRVLTLLLICGAASLQADIIHFEDFESDAVSYITNEPEATDGDLDYFIHTNGGNLNPGVNFQNHPAGNFFFGAQDINGVLPTPQGILVFQNIDIAGYDNLTFHGLFAEDQALDGSEDWDAADQLIVEYSIDGGGLIPVFSIQNDGSTFNSAPFVDTNLDGTGDGMEITDSFMPFSTNIGGTGSFLDLYITITLDSGDEDIAFDNITIMGDPAAIPEPSSILMLMLVGLLASGRGLLRRFRPTVETGPAA